MRRLKGIFLLAIWLFLSKEPAFSQQKIEQWNRFELKLPNSSDKNNFSDNLLSATFTHKDTSIIISGFYDGNNQYVIRFMPEKTGIWKYSTNSPLTTLNNKRGEFECIKAVSNNHGVVRVSQIYHFKYADSTAYFPFGTTAYAWTHMAEGVQQQTLKSLQNAGFNKIRMCVFPKNYELVKEEPPIYPYIIKEVKKDAKGNEVKVWDFNQFNPVFFQHLEKRIDDLRTLGIEADLILFHPYDKGRWGFDEIPMAANLNYIKYLVARLASFRNVWWSLANEYDYVKSKTDKDWEALIKAVVKADPYHHLCSIHGSTAKYFDYRMPEITHTSIQDESPVINWGGSAIVRSIYPKPIIFDEVGYEGNLKSRWGRYSGEEMNHLIWMGLIGGTYVTHGESFMFKDHRDTIFWAKGGKFAGKSWKRAAFARKILTETGPLEMADVSRDFKTATNGKGTYLIYFGKEMLEYWSFDLPHKNANSERPKSGTKYKVEIIDTWDMTVTKVNTVFEGAEVNDYRIADKENRKIRLPLKPYIALRIIETTPD
ncbi:DUF5060 domain-containing protein [Emticicia sp. BO119]|uniref:DUF5060 domain-containing protein n=1 Tax=Emticicia sp. BO119 TaxID=2757768 RepID=UPI0015F02A25|nr:DUF5060 domain-containing protein [Emticicia sp. BO119]MBA4850382.1 DUF5605 domain-containing protein [Emticicia sp. BO119]